MVRESLGIWVKGSQKRATVGWIQVAVRFGEGLRKESFPLNRKLAGTGRGHNIVYSHILTRWINTV